MTESTFLVRYEAAKAALEQAVLVDEVLDIRDSGLKMRAYAKIAKDRRLQADAAVIVLRAERKLGVMIQSAHETGQLGIGRPAKSNVSELHDLKEKHVPEDENGSVAEPITRVTLKEAGIDKKLSMKAQRWAKMGDPEFEAKLQEERDRIESVGAETVNGARAVMAGRRESTDSLDFFPTPPWATRALVEDVLPALGIQLQGMDIWEPACGEGHITGVLEEYGLAVDGTDIFNYSADGRAPPCWVDEHDFLLDAVHEKDFPSWIITNPPFGEASLGFALRSIELARVGVALFVRTQWLEGVDRYEKLFRDTPPTLFAQFAERVNLCKGRWEPDGSTASQYCWLVWVKDASPRAPFWIPPGRRVERTKLGDIERFTAHPVKPLDIRQDEPVDPAGEGRTTLSGRPDSVAADPGAGALADQSGDGSLGQPLVGTVAEGGEGVTALPADPLAAYEAALAAGAPHHGKHSKVSIEPILKAGVAASVTGAQMALDTDSKLGSILGWKGKLGLTGLGTGRAAPRKHLAEAGS